MPFAAPGQNILPFCNIGRRWAGLTRRLREICDFVLTLVNIM
jgi:hypothetical protein